MSNWMYVVDLFTLYLSFANERGNVKFTMVHMNT